jgi:hypothetical protein
MELDSISHLACEVISYQYNRGCGYHDHFINGRQRIIRDLMLAGF